MPHENEDLVLEYKGCKAYVIPEMEPWDPRDDPEACISTMWCWHRNYTLGDNDKDKPSDFNHFKGWLDENKKDIIIESLHPIRMYDHSGIGLSLSASGYPFNCPWDSMWVGYIFLERRKVMQAYGVKRITKKTKERAIEQMKSEFAEYDHYVRGDCFGWEIRDESEDVVDGCWGYFGYWDNKKELMEELKATIDRFRTVNLEQLPLPAPLGPKEV